MKSKFPEVDVYEKEISELPPLTNQILTDPIVRGILSGDPDGARGFVLKDIKNLPDGVLSGTPKVIEVNISGATYYFKVYPVLT